MKCMDCFRKQYRPSLCVKMVKDGCLCICSEFDVITKKDMFYAYTKVRADLDKHIRRIIKEGKVINNG